MFPIPNRVKRVRLVEMDIWGERGDSYGLSLLPLMHFPLLSLLSDDSEFSGNETVTHPSLPAGMLFDSEATEV